MSGRGTTVARALRMPIPILARKLTQRGRALTHRLMADTTWRTDGVTPELLRALRDGGHSRFFVHPADRSAGAPAGRGARPPPGAGPPRAPRRGGAPPRPP